MFKVILPVLLIVLAVYIGMNTRGGLVRGVADGMLVSPARPAVAVRPAPAFALAACRSRAAGAGQYAAQHFRTGLLRPL